MSARQAVTVHYAGGVLPGMSSVGERHKDSGFRFGLI